MTPCALVGVDSGGTRTLVTVALERAGAEPKQETYEHDETLSGSMSPDRLPELVCHVLGEGELSANLRRVGWSAGVPIYMWIGAAGYTPWTRDNFKTAVNTIRDLLGHASLGTTNLYARSDLCTQRKALEQVDGSMRPGKPPRWKRDTELLAWLDAL